jgi:hypothetical protein
MVLDLCHEFPKYLLDVYYGLLGAKDIVFKLDMVKVPASGKSLQLDGKASSRKKKL